jgi:hypothetical protein
LKNICDVTFGEDYKKLSEKMKKDKKKAGKNEKK